MAITGVDNFVTSGLTRSDTLNDNLEATMNRVLEGGEVKNEDLIMLNYEMSKYQTYITSLNNTIQSVQNQTKELAKSIH
ncbi:MAG: hypothetical protein LBQ63_06235 [Deltaproteobacteria bacterium]|jgi:flagellar biosynthesis chaperone FliJ|nr:hypothetical protein [Deltaproteobacteria bacterium]